MIKSVSRVIESCILEMTHRQIRKTLPDLVRLVKLMWTGYLFFFQYVSFILLVAISEYSDHLVRCHVRLFINFLSVSVLLPRMLLLALLSPSFADRCCYAEVLDRWCLADGKCLIQQTAIVSSNFSAYRST